MTTTQELIARMRGFGIFGEANALLREGAASIESLSAEVERLESDVLVQKGMARLARGECDQLRAQLEAQGEAVDILAIPDKPWCKDLTFNQLLLHLELAKREPPYIVQACLTAAEMLKRIKELGPLYTHPAPAAPVVESEDPISDADAWYFVPGKQ